MSTKPLPDPDDKPQGPLFQQKIDEVPIELLREVFHQTSKKYFEEVYKGDLPVPMQMQASAIAALAYSWTIVYHLSDNNKANALEWMSRNLNTITAEDK
jgi:hypothetical protein